MRKKYKITFEINAHYPHAEKYIKRLSKDFDKWLLEWATSDQHIPVPLLFEPNKNGAIEHQANAGVKVKIVRDGEIILDTNYDVLSDDF